MKNLSGRIEIIKQIDIQLYQKFVSGLLTLEECEKILNIKLI